VTPSLRAVKLAAGKVDVEAALVARLVAAQFPQWARLPVTPAENDGWDNWTFRLGDRLKVRLPSAPGYAGQAEKEAQWLPLLAPSLPVRVPVPVGLGKPAAGYPFRWSVYDWIKGEPAGRSRIADLGSFARDIGGFLHALQQADARGGPPPGAHNFERGGALGTYDAETRACIAELGERIDGAGALAVWEAALASAWRGPPVWVHGDIAAGNLLIRDGRLSAVIDFGCLAAGDPACDLVIAWVFLDGDAREAFRAAAPGNAECWARARGWAIWKALLVAARNLTRNPLERAPETVIADIIAEHRRGRMPA
jgi:aminoglycoside phosphotransferase (APT) family kinase protein